MINFLPLKFFTVFFSMELLLGYFKTFLLEVEGVRWVRVRTQWGGVVASVHLHTMGRVVKLCCGSYKGKLSVIIAFVSRTDLSLKIYLNVRWTFPLSGYNS